MTDIYTLTQQIWLAGVPGGLGGWVVMVPFHVSVGLCLYMAYFPENNFSFFGNFNFKFYVHIPYSTVSFIMTFIYTPLLM